MNKFLGIGLTLVVAACPALGRTYEPLVNWVEANAGGASTLLYAGFAEGNSAYVQLSGGNAPRITRVDNLDQAVRTTTELVSASQWGTASGGQTGLTSFYGFSGYGTYLQFTDASTDAIWRINKSTGAITPYITKAQIKAFTGGSDVASLTGGDTAPDGEFIWYDGNTKQILKSTGMGTMATLISNADLNGLMGAATVAATSMSAATDGSLYITNSGTDTIYKRAADGTLSAIITPAFITAVNGNSSINFKDILAAPDGWVYVLESTSLGNIMRFQPANPTGTLELYMSNAELNGGPAGSAAANALYQLSWYKGRLTFNIFQSTAARGLYSVVPEPASLGFLALGGLALLRRRSR
jgi:hypothetical protein